MPFEPPRCPASACPSHRHPRAWRYRRNGTYPRACDGRRVQRFVCRACGLHFSTQTFRHKKPLLNLALFDLLVSKVTLRQAARVLRVNYKAVALRLPLLGEVAHALHDHLAPRRSPHGFVAGRFLLDELETYADSRRNNPLTVPVLIHAESFFVVHTEVGPLPRRGGRGRDEREPPEMDENERMERNRGSRAAVGACCERLARLAPEKGDVVVATDEKLGYPGLLRRALGERLVHEQTNSKEQRSWRNPLFRINLTLAMLRDGVSRLVRRTWAASKLEERLRDHLWIWIAWRNYVRGMTNACWGRTPAMRVGVCRRKLRAADIFRWRGAFVPALFGR